MSRNQSVSLCLSLSLLLLGLTGCSMQKQWGEASSTTVVKQQLEGLPYHPLIYHLDLCTLSYQLYGQSLVWPFDPYYEELNNWQWDRTKYRKKVHAWAVEQGVKQVARGQGLGAYRGPGVLGGFENNPAHDPIIYRYDRIHPWSHTITNGSGVWTEYATPKELTRSVRDVYVCYRKTGAELGEVALEKVKVGRRGFAQDAQDVIIAFEGGTGDKGESGQPASQSLMGFVLLRNSDSGNSYDVHIAFRGSRSGSAARSAFQARSSSKAQGNPDWITDMGYSHLRPDAGENSITKTGKVNRGFARSMESIFPQVFQSLEKVAELKSGRRPERIYVTGHSLGGALAQHFVSAVLMGEGYGPSGSESSASAGNVSDAGDARNAMPTRLRVWPWQQIKLITFGAPRAGDDTWARALTEKGLEADFFSTFIDPYDRKALPVAHPSIVPRLLDKDRPTGYRVVLTKDPITTAKLYGGKHVGKSVYVDRPGLSRLVASWSFDHHEPATTRRMMLERLEDARIPPVAWYYREMSEINPERDDSKRGSIEEFKKLKAATERYYRDKGIWFDLAAFRKDFEIHSSLLEP